MISPCYFGPPVLGDPVYGYLDFFYFRSHGIMHNILSCTKFNNKNICFHSTDLGYYMDYTFSFVLFPFNTFCLFLNKNALRNEISVVINYIIQIK
jgi:hypothetical protein